eukprot:404863-Prymnesium_polylepis.1
MLTLHALPVRAFPGDRGDRVAARGPRDDLPLGLVPLALCRPRHRAQVRRQCAHDAMCVDSASIAHTLEPRATITLYHVAVPASV